MTDARERVHLLHVPGGRPIDLGFSPQGRCGSCAAQVSADQVLHQEHCEAGRQMAAAMADYDVTRRAGVDLAAQARQVIADEHVQGILDDDERVIGLIGTADLSDDERAKLSRELARTYLAGFGEAERSITSLARAELVRLRGEIDRAIAQIDAWSPVDDEG